MAKITISGVKRQTTIRQNIQFLQQRTKPIRKKSNNPKEKMGKGYE